MNWKDEQEACADQQWEENRPMQRALRRGKQRRSLWHTQELLQHRWPQELSTLRLKELWPGGTVPQPRPQPVPSSAPRPPWSLDARTGE